ncbi:GmrSD restriction endonuclease domain-containing protein [Hymenobacter qilianensis]|uniref:DUF262 domain-containing protein n=1 Tax=Hymenobacter qilianensis TaxID=1385715 RepID=A0A7H0GY57_9BACT|nr:DUF262 domain-containing protein [Hymenobacter qilianensis]QNP53223.1 DUF262 domain-containing protein [Hymenobacter qilianensis]
MKSFDTRVYNVADFLEWHRNNLLELSPDFQRRSVWSEKAKSFLIDTILTGKPIPKILITQSLRNARTVRVVVDGQQRLRAIIGFIDGDFKISRAHNKELAGYTFENLPEDQKREFLQYELGVDLLFDLPYEDILDIFARLNSYTVSLNKIEIINAKYLGYFKQYVFKYGYKYVEYFIQSNVLTKSQVTRMAEAELSADLFVALVDGVQSNKNVEKFYKEYEESLGELDEKAEQFDMIMSYIGEIYPPSELRNTNWSRVQLFYTLFTSIGHCLFGLRALEPITGDFIINNKIIGKIRVRLDEISSVFDEINSEKETSSRPPEYRRFVEKSQKATTDTGSRVDRTNFVVNEIIDAFI